MRNLLIEIDAIEKSPENKNKEIREKVNTILKRFGNLPTSSGKGREILLIQQSITRGYQRDTIHEDSNPYLSPESSKYLRNLNWIRLQIRNEIRISSGEAAMPVS